LNNGTVRHRASSSFALQEFFMNASGLSADQLKLQARARALAAGPIAKRAAEVDRTEQYPWDNVDLLKDARLIGMAIAAQ